MGKIAVLFVCFGAWLWFLWLYYLVVRSCYAEGRRSKLQALPERELGSKGSDS